MKAPICSLTVLLCFCLTACGSEKREDTQEKTNEITTEMITENITEKETVTEVVTEATTENTEDETTEEDTEEQKEEVDYSPYYEIIQKVEDIDPENITDDFMYPDIYAPTPDEVSLIFYEKYYEDSSLGYAFIDIDNNGIDELVLGEPGKYGILNIYTLLEGKLVNVFYGWERYSCYITEDNKIATHGSGGAGNVSYMIYDYSNGSLIYSDGVYSFTQDATVYYYHGDIDKHDEIENPQISQDEYWNEAESHPAKAIEFTVFNRYKK